MGLRTTTYIKQRVWYSDKVRHRCQKIVDEWKRKNWYEDMLPVHWIDYSIGCLDTSTQTIQFFWSEYYSPFIQHRSKYNYHVITVHSIVILCQVTLKFENISQRSVNRFKDKIKTNINKLWKNSFGSKESKARKLKCSINVKIQN